MWFGAFLIFGIGFALVGVREPWPDDAVLFYLIAVTCVLVGLPPLRCRIVADEKGVTVTNPLSRYTVAWADLADIGLEKSEVGFNLGFTTLLLYRGWGLALSTTDGRTLLPYAPQGRKKPGSTVPRLQQTLLAMRDRYIAEPTIPASGELPKSPARVVEASDERQGAQGRREAGHGSHPEAFEEMWARFTRFEELIITLAAIGVPIVLFWAIDAYVSIGWLNGLAQIVVTGVGDLAIVALLFALFAAPRLLWRRLHGRAEPYRPRHSIAFTKPAP